MQKSHNNVISMLPLTGSLLQMCFANMRVETTKIGIGSGKGGTAQGRDKVNPQAGSSCGVGRSRRDFFSRINFMKYKLYLYILRTI
jgi:hypothetical protein